LVYLLGHRAAFPDRSYIEMFKLPEGLIDHDGARLFGLKDLEVVVRDCAQICRNEMNAANLWPEKAILARYGLEDK
jgi:hypothetical protein